MFKRILVANRGEIACRVIRAAHALGAEAVAVYSDADAEAPHTVAADATVHVGPAPALESYLRIDHIIDAATSTGCDALHPGYGFLSENPALVRAAEDAGIAFIGPSAHSLENMGDKVQARRLFGQAGLPLVPASDGPVEDPQAARGIAAEIGYPLVVKAASGGGGIGMLKVEDPASLERALSLSAERARTAFGSGAVYLEKFVHEPHHVEVQVLGDGQRAIHLFERECSVQRRFQKIIEEARAPFRHAPVAEMLDTATKAARQVGYVSAGTLECLVSGTGEFYFLEINRRIQVEHPVTEAITGLDLVAAQIRIAADGILPFGEEAVSANGHAIEFRICAEDPWRFVPSPGTLQEYVEPEGDGIRVDAGVRRGSRVSMYYDSLLAKLIVHGKDRAEALARARAALDGFRIAGVKTNLPLHRAIVDDEIFISGNYTTDFLTERMAVLSGTRRALTG